ncbi:SpoIIE family protein phosphatase [Streptomyces glaucus]|uniref:Magnesium or manganese-dependent protein phosphatase n=1 Tax=Streptomyces glaucus TaxID=284029 RepID=A0ABN3JUH1_9ACTN
MPGSASPHVLLAGVDDATEAVLRTELGGRAAVRRLPSGEAVPPDAADEPTLLVVGADVPAPAGLVSALQTRTRHLAVIVVTGRAGADDTSALSLLAPAERLAYVRADDPDGLARAARSMLDRLALQHAYRTAQAAAQRRLLAGGEVARQPGEQLFGPLYHQVLIGAVAVDAAGRVIAWNRKAADILSLRNDAAGRSFPLLFPPHVRGDLREHLARAALVPSPPTLFERLGDDGAAQTLRMSAQAVTNPDGTTHTLVILEDITSSTETRRQLAERTSHALLSGDVAAAMTAGDPLRQRLQRSAQAVVDRLGVAVARIWTLDAQENTLVLQAAAGPHGHLDGGPSRIRVGDPGVGLIAAERKPHLTNAVTDDRYADDQDWIRREGMAAFAGYPLINDGELMGVMALFSRRPLPETAFESLAGIAGQIAVGISQDRLLDRLRATTEALQRPLLPPDLPTLPGLDIVARYRAQGDSLDIGGDFYDVFPLPDGQWALTLGDVCGKGPTAAAVTGLVRHTLWTAAQQDPDPAHVLPSVHRALLRENSPFCTLVYALLDPSDTPVRLRVTSAGHPAPLLRRRGGRTRLLEEHGPLLGAFRATGHPVQSTVLHPGDSLILYTDGFTEGSGAHLSREPEDLAALLASWTGPSDDRLADRLADLLFTDAVTRWAGRLRDDLALVAISAHP